GLVPLAGSNNESWCQGLDGLASRSAAYYQQGARFAKWRTVVSIPNGPSALAVKEAAWGLARYAAISQDNAGIAEPEILLDGEHNIDRTFEVAKQPSMVTPEQSARRRPPHSKLLSIPSISSAKESHLLSPGIMFLSGGQLKLRQL
ncbi:hypothetical protein HAX54_001304, partial [Datura stramonium]|nr:hypothetical protein [Datura stramonium]